MKVSSAIVVRKSHDKSTWLVRGVNFDCRDERVQRVRLTAWKMSLDHPGAFREPSQLSPDQWGHGAGQQVENLRIQRTWPMYSTSFPVR